MTRTSLISLQKEFDFLSLQMLSVALLLVTLSSCRAFVERYRPIQVTERWAGVMSAEDAGKFQDSVFLIQDSETWQRVFQAWSDGETPQVDFQRELIVVVRGRGPNTLILDELSKNRDRDLRVNTITTFMGGPSDCYLFLRIPKTDVESINGKRISDLEIAK